MIPSGTNDLPGALLAQMLFNLFAGADLSQMNRRLSIALFAFHI